MYYRRGALLFFKVMCRQISRSHRTKNRRFLPKLGLSLLFFFRSFIKFQGHTGWNICHLNLIWVRLLGRSQLSNLSDLPCSTTTNILLTKSNLKFESRATAVYVAMSPHYLDGKYRSRLHPQLRKMRVSVFAGDWMCEIELRQTGVICFPWRQRS